MVKDRKYTQKTYPKSRKVGSTTQKSNNKTYCGNHRGLKIGIISTAKGEQL